MATRTMTDWRTRAETRRNDWLPNSVLSGFVATFAMTALLAVAYGLARGFGDQTGSTLERWFWALANNEMTRTTRDGIALAIALNLLMGMVWAVVYARVVEPAIGGRGWRKGILFALIPWVLSVIAFLPIMGGGFLGSDLDAGPLPVLGNLLLHVVYGAVLGMIYEIRLETGLDDNPADRAAAAGAERGAAIGLAVGLAIGLIVGWFTGATLDGFGGQGWGAVAGAMLGAAMGLTAGSFLGMGGDGRGVPRSR